MRCLLKKEKKKMLLFSGSLSLSLHSIQHEQSIFSESTGGKCVLGGGWDFAGSGNMKCLLKR